MSAEKSSGLGGVVAGGVTKGLKGLAATAGKRLLSKATDRIGETTQRLTDFTDNGGGGGGLMSAITGGGGGGRGGGNGGKKLKVTNIVEWVDVGVPIRLAYDQWTQFTDFPSFMKKVESVEQEDETKLQWKAQVFWSHRQWEATITEQVPDRRIIWKSSGQKGSVDGAVTFHEVAPELTRICVILQYRPQGFMERTGNLWRAQGRRARLELKHFARHVMTEAVLNPDEIQGWRGEIHEGEVTKDDQQAREEEQQAREEEERAPEQQEKPEAEGRRRPEDLGERQPEDQERRRRPEDEERGRRPEDRGERRRREPDEDRPTRRPPAGRDRDETRQRDRDRSKERDRESAGGDRG